MWGIAIVGCFAAVIALIPPVGRLAWRIGAVDVPRDWRRMHTDSVPRAGGIAMLAAIGACWLLFCPHTVSLAAGRQSARGQEQALVCFLPCCGWSR